MALPLGIAQAAIGIGGLFGASAAARQQAKYQKAATDALKVRTNGMKEALTIAQGYDPAAETQKAVDYASATASDRLGKSLGDINQRFRNAGGSPTGDTLFRVNAQGAANRVADPLKAFAAQQASQATQMKLSALSSALGNGGDIADTYLQLANGSAPDYSGAIQAFSSGFGNISGSLAKKPAKKFYTQEDDGAQ